MSTVTAYFWNRWEAEEAAGELRMLCAVQGPKIAPVPRDGKSFEIVVVLPTTLSPMPLYPDPHVMSRINQVIMKYDGTTADNAA